MILAFLIFSLTTQAQSECASADPERIGPMTAQASAYAQKVTEFKKRYPAEIYTDPTARKGPHASKVIKFCLDPKGMNGAVGLSNEGVPVYQSLSQFASGQTGPCQTSATTAAEQVANDIRSLREYRKACN